MSVVPDPQLASDASLLTESPSESVVLVRLNRPHVRNALNLELRRELAATFEMLGRSDGVHCIVVTNDDRAFCAGADINKYVDATPADVIARNMDLLWGTIANCPSRSSQPSTAMRSAAAANWPCTPTSSSRAARRSSASPKSHRDHSRRWRHAAAYACRGQVRRNAASSDWRWDPRRRSEGRRPGEPSCRRRSGAGYSAATRLPDCRAIAAGRPPDQGDGPRKHERAARGGSA